MTDRVPIIKIGGVLMVSIQIDLSDETTLALQEDLSDRIVETGAHGVIIEISALEIVDTFIGRMLATIAAVSRVLDAETVVVGMRPAVAITLAELGLTLGGVRTALNAERAFEMLRYDAPGATSGENDDGAGAGLTGTAPDSLSSRRARD